MNGIIKALAGSPVPEYLTLTKQALFEVSEASEATETVPTN